jgi:rhomboid family GlyGly-CTERM serine protease
MMDHSPSSPRWTIAITVALVLLNFGLLVDDRPPRFLDQLEFERRAVLDGEYWRLITSQIIHWSARHFFLDVGAFLVLGWMSERYFRRSYPLLLLWIAFCVGVAGIWLLPDHARMRGLSGVNAGQFAALLWIEIGLAIREPRRWLWLAPATVFFLFWIGYGAITGRGFLMGPEHHIAGWAHLVGAGAALAWLAVRTVYSRSTKQVS